MKFIIFTSMIIVLVQFTVAQNTRCNNLPDGTKLPDESNCSYFFLCDIGFALRLRCPQNRLFFNRCTGECETNNSVCTITCPDTTTTTTTTTTTPSTTTTTTATTTSTTVSTTTTTLRTTMANTAPTVPVFINCTEDCTSAEICLVGPSDCLCIERCRCMGDGNCGCDPNIPCPFDKDDCEAECGCEEKCVEDKNCKADPNNAGKFICTECLDDVQCPFPEADCATKCGCADNCKCTDDKCNCNPIAECNCVTPPDVCPFERDECMARCLCDERCENTCFGVFCTCDPAVRCPASFNWMGIA